MKQLHLLEFCFVTGSLYIDQASLKLMDPPVSPSLLVTYVYLLLQVGLKACATKSGFITSF